MMERIVKLQHKRIQKKRELFSVTVSGKAVLVTDIRYDPATRDTPVGLRDVGKLSSKCLRFFWYILF
jgi:hypothetical protein